MKKVSATEGAQLWSGSSPRVNATIIIPAYNSEKTIKQTIDACKNQKFSGSFEIIVVDDGSTDNTKKVAEDAGARVFSQKNSGPAKARNFGAKKAKFDIFVFTDADCTPEKNWLSEMVAPFNDKEVVGVQGAYKTKQRSLTARFSQAEIEERYDLMKKNSTELDWIGSYSAAYRKKDFFDANGFDESFPKASGEDPELSYKLHKAGKKLVFNPKAIVYHLHPDSVWKYFRQKFYRAFYRVLLYGKHPEKMKKDSYTPNSIKVQILSGYVGLALLFIIPTLYFYNLDVIALAILTGNTVLVFVATFYTVLSAIKARNDPFVAFFTLIMVQVRTLAFMLGLPAGIIKYKVLK
ncbi:MAG TPA: glycosyltransferase [archaeon]|nr:glycosyltransferase [archaeon]